MKREITYLYDTRLIDWQPTQGVNLTFDRPIQHSKSLYALSGSCV